MSQVLRKRKRREYKMVSELGENDLKTQRKKWTEAKNKYRKSKDNNQRTELENTQINRFKDLNQDKKRVLQDKNEGHKVE